jgi:hypothetical protein
VYHLLFVTAFEKGGYMEKPLELYIKITDEKTKKKIMKLWKKKIAVTPFIINLINSAVI